MLKRTILAASCAALAASAAFCADAPAKRKARPKAAHAVAEAPLGGKAGGAPRARFEAHLRERLKKISDAHVARMSFLEREDKTWQEFWGKVKEERNQFEIKLARQSLAFFESLATLEVKDHGPHITNYEKLQNDVIKNFESTHRQRMAEFFSEREARLHRYAEEQERDRADFAAEGEVAWQDNKAGLKPHAAERPAPDEEPRVEGPPEPAPVKALPPKSSASARPNLEPKGDPMKRKRASGDDKWH